MDELEEYIEWLRVLGLPEDEFRAQVRPRFNDTAEMDAYLEPRNKGRHRTR